MLYNFVLHSWSKQYKSKNMKLPISMKSIITLVLMVSFFSCSKEKLETKTEENYPAKWQLVKMTGSFSNSETTGSNMSWQEYYIFYSDSTFLKSREQSGSTKEATGTYAYDAVDKNKLLLTYKTGVELMASCLVAKKEYLRLESSNKMVATVNACDGPGLEYQLVK